jgi:hypothetical protein
MRRSDIELAKIEMGIAYKSGEKHEINPVQKEKPKAAETVKKEDTKKEKKKETNAEAKK